MKKMKAAYMTDFGGPEVFSVGELNTPALKPGYVLLRTEAAGVNYYDMLVRIGAVSKEIPLPHIPGSDIVGSVVGTGEGVTRFKEGDAVIAVPGFPVDPQEWEATPVNYQPSYYPGGTFTHGGYAQFVLINEKWLLHNDLDMAPTELACLPLVLLTAMHTVKTLGEVGSGQRVLVHGGASGSGSMAIQVAKALGASVITTVSTPGKAAVANAVGADEIVFYKKENFAEAARAWSQGDGVDVVIDNLGGSAFPDNLRALKWGGILVNFGLVAGIEAKIPNMYEFFRGQYQIRGSFMGTVQELEEGLALVRAGKIKAALDEAVSLERVRKVHTRIDNHQINGKMVLLPWE